MAFRDFPKDEQAVQLLQRSLARGRLGHGYLFTGHGIDELESAARTLAKTLNCEQPARSPGGAASDCCETCLVCRKIEHANHADVHWVRPESKTRIITIEQMRDLMKEIQLKPTEAHYKVAVIVAADRLKTEAANAFLKTLEEPPPRSVLILLTTEPQRLLETIVSRCLRLNFAGEGPAHLNPEKRAWLAGFSDLAAVEQKSLLGRYLLMDALLRKLTEMKEGIQGTLAARSPLERYDDVEKDLRDQWEDELAAAIEAEYRRQRSDLLVLVEWWLRDVWLLTLAGGRNSAAATQPLLSFPELAGTQRIARRISVPQAVENLEVLEQLQRRLYTNVQEALALEVGLLKLHL